jgi:uncharacterized protein
MLCTSCGAELPPNASTCASCGTPVPAPAPAPAPSLAPAPNLPQVAIAPETVRQWAMWSHLSALGGVVFPFGNVLGPLIIWLIKRDEIPEVNVEAKEALNFQITMSAAGVALWVISIFLTIVSVMMPRGLSGIFSLFIGMIELVGYLGLIAAWIVFVTQATLAANKGESYRYPYSIRLVK